MDPRDAISRIHDIREQLARAEAFRVYRAASVVFTGLMAFLGAAIQSRWQLNDRNSFLVLWICIAILSGGIVGVEMMIRCRYSDSVLLRDAAMVAARQFTPCLVAGGLLTLVAYQLAPQLLPLLPGLWAILFSLGIFASLPGLPSAVNFVGAYYLLAGLLVIALTGSSSEFQIWPMPLCFGVGQMLIALVLYVAIERVDETF